VGGVIDIECKEGRKGFVVSITNTGLMLSSTDLSSIFKDTFYRSADAKKMNPAGMGVSLLVARTIIQAHKGSISLDVDERGLSRVSLQFKKI
jgi:two-component system sensor histidine kinase VicK